MIQLHGFGPTRSLRVLWALNELGVEYEFISVNLQLGENRTPEFLGVNPAGKLPVLVDGDTVLSESAAIVLYLAEKYPAKGLIPTGLGERAEIYRRLSQSPGLPPAHVRTPDGTAANCRRLCGAWRGGESMKGSHVFDTDQGQKSLAGLFGECTQLASGEVDYNFATNTIEPCAGSGCHSAEIEQ